MKKFLTKNSKLVQVCTNCIYDENVDGIKFDIQGKCNYCAQIESLIKEYGTGGKKGKLLLKEIFRKIKEHGRGKKYDCIVGVSGGTDSSYLIDLVHKEGLRPLAVHFDNTWNSEIATMNIKKMLKSLKIDLYTMVINGDEMDDIFRSFFLAGVAELDSSTDLGYASLLYKVATKFNVKYVLEGHSFVTEGITPLGSNYFDGKYIQGIHKKYGKIKMNSYPLMTFTKFLYWTLFKRIKKIRPLWYIDYSKEKARKILEKKFGWQYYGGHHLENQMTKFVHLIYFPSKFNTDYSNNNLSALVRNKIISRDEAWRIYTKKKNIDKPLLDYFLKRLKLSKKEYERIMKKKPRYWTEFPTYKKRFEFFAPIFFLMQKANLVPKSFYLKYCKKN